MGAWTGRRAVRTSKANAIRVIAKIEFLIGLDDVDKEVLEELIMSSLENLKSGAVFASHE
jgi:hypothetical protein